ncbi:hypothetical protein [Enterococcus thailandicus]|uniref:hypothetical protein n=1 Tax=Enterococcus TaxID=1350 RepID=UPI0032E3D51D
MLDRLKQFGRNFTETTPFILSNTVIFIPYLLFLSLNNGYNWATVLPFTLFYTFRMTGLFLIRGIHAGLDSYTLLMISLLVGGAGSLLGLFGLLSFPLFYLSAICLGLSAAWLVPANVTVNFHEKQQGFINIKGKKYIYALIMLALLYEAVRLPMPLQLAATLGFYTLLYVMAYHTVKHYPRYELDFKDVQRNLIEKKELILFFGFFISLFLLRTARLLMDTVLFDVALFSILLLYILITFYLSRKKQTWVLPSWLNLLTFLDGMLGNFLFLFGTFYLGIIAGFNQLATTLYFPYIVGLILAKIVGPVVTKKLPEGHSIASYCLGLLVSFGVLFSPNAFSIGILLLSLVHTLLGSHLNRLYEQLEEISPDQRLIVKYTTQNKGSLTHQFFLMGVLLFLTKQLGQPIRFLLRMTGTMRQSAESIQLVEQAKWFNLSVLILLTVIVYYLWKEAKKNATIH